MSAAIYLGGNSGLQGQAWGYGQRMKQLLLLVMAVAMVGCASPIFGIVKNNKANMAKLSVGMSKAQVLETMGPADKTEAYETKTGGTMEFLLYRIEVANLDEEYKDRHWTPLCIIDGKLKGWGRNFYDDTIKIRKEIIKK